MSESLWSWITAPWALRPDTLFGATTLLVAAALLGELVWRGLRWPRLVGYGVVGTVLALAGMGADAGDTTLRLVVDFALGVLLFEAGARLNLRWLVRNPWLLASSLLESLVSGVAVYGVSRWLGLEPLVAAALALIAVSVSPAVVQRVVDEVGAAGQVTERLMTLSALNTLIAVLAMKGLSAGLRLADPQTWQAALPSVVFSLFGSVVLGALLGAAIALIARRFDLRNQNAVVLLLGCVGLALVAAKTLQLSTLLVPLLAGMWLRNRTERPWVWPRHFGSAGGVMVLVLFVAVASAWSPAVLPQALGVAALLVAVRWGAKAAVVGALARPSGLSWRQAACLGAGLLPMSATAWVLALDFNEMHPAAGEALMPLLLSMLALSELPGVLVLLLSLRSAREADPHEAMAR